MVNHRCEKCEKTFTKKSLYTEHINRKKKCDEIQYMKQCLYCNKNFSTKSSVTRHIKNNCKVYKKTEEDKRIIYDKLIQLEKQIVKLQDENKKLKRRRCGTSKIINNIGIHNTGVINNNITIVACGKEDKTKINIKSILNAVSRGFKSPVHLTKVIHFNDKHPEYQNVYIPSVKDSYAMTFDGTEWKLVQKKDLIETIYMDKKYYIEENLEDFAKSLSDYKIRSLKKWLEYDDNDDKCIKLIKKDIEILLYNERGKPMTNRSNMEKLNN